jgi:hypothetical protein
MAGRHRREDLKTRKRLLASSLLKASCCGPVFDTASGHLSAAAFHQVQQRQGRNPGVGPVDCSFANIEARPYPRARSMSGIHRVHLFNFASIEILARSMSGMSALPPCDWGWFRGSRRPQVRLRPPRSRLSGRSVLLDCLQTAPQQLPRSRRPIGHAVLESKFIEAGQFLGRQHDLHSLGSCRRVGHRPASASCASCANVSARFIGIGSHKTAGTS